jgi:hypothetical protein
VCHAEVDRLSEIRNRRPKIAAQNLMLSPPQQREGDVRDVTASASLTEGLIENGDSFVE